MTTRRAKFGISMLALSLSSAGFTAPKVLAGGPEIDIDINVFYEELAPYGDWVEVEDYGYAWTPTAVPVGFRPYTDGHWVYADDCGWTWVSDYEWGWAPFHYGRWTMHPVHGWIWIPGTEWAPAWVSWRRGEGYVGWAPLPPEPRHTEVSVDIGSLGVHVSVEDSAWSFVEERYVVEPHVHRHLVLPARNVTLCRSTNNVSKYVSVGGRIGNFSLDVQVVERSVGRRINRLRVRDVNVREVDARVGGRTRVLGDELAVFRPRVRKASAEDGVRFSPPVRKSVARDHTEDAYRTRSRVLETRQTSDRIALEQEHRVQRKSLQRQVDPTEIERRHAAERRAQEEQQERDRTVLRRRYAPRSNQEAGPTRRSEEGRGSPRRGRDEARPGPRSNRDEAAPARRSKGSTEQPSGRSTKKKAKPDDDRRDRD